MKRESPKSNALPYPQTPESAHQWFVRHGINIAQWCRDQRISRDAVYMLLRKRAKGRRGEMHRAAVLLGLKEAV